MQSFLFHLLGCLAILLLPPAALYPAFQTLLSADLLQIWSRELAFVNFLHTVFVIHFVLILAGYAELFWLHGRLGWNLEDSRQVIYILLSIQWYLYLALFS